MATINLSFMQALSFPRLFSPYSQNAPTLSFNLHPKPSINVRPITLKPYHSEKPRTWVVALAVKNLGETEAVVVSPENDGTAGELPSGTGVYAVYDKGGELQFIGLSRNIAASVSAHRKSVPELCCSIKVEGAANEDGRKPSIWDTYTHDAAIHKGNGDIACDQYHKYKEDVQLMAKMGLDAYRFSISWSRLIPDGKGPINPKGLQYYNNLINELTSQGIQAHVTLVHWDIPQELEDEYGGWISRRIIKDFTSYADVCFREFGDRVKHWTTVNEGNVFAIGGYDAGFLPPQRCSPSFHCSNTKGNSSTEPYLVAHHMLLAHASAAKLYRKKYQHKQHGFIGFNLLVFGFVPLTNTSEDIIAAQRAQDFYIGWFLNPLIFGEYPGTMKENVGSRLPFFTNKESILVKGSIDFLGINYYYAFYVKDSPGSLQIEDRDFTADMAVEVKVITGNSTSISEVPITPWVLQGLLDSLKNIYGNFPIYIHENGQQSNRNSSLDDWPRVKYLQEYIGTLLDMLRNGLNVRGYFVWSFMDVFELLSGYESSFGLYYIDLEDPTLKRQPKLSAVWYTNFLNNRTMDSKVTMEIEKNASVLFNTPLLHNAT